MAKTYKIMGYMVDANGDDDNEIDIKLELERYTDLFGKLDVTISPEWEWDDACPENKYDCKADDYEARFK